MPVRKKLKVGETILLRAKVTRVAADSATVRVPGYDVPITLSSFTLEESENVMPDAEDGRAQ